MKTLTFDFQHGCHCAEFPHTIFEVGFQNRLRTGNYVTEKLAECLLWLEAQRITLNHSNSICSESEYLSGGVLEYSRHIFAEQFQKLKGATA